MRKILLTLFCFTFVSFSVCANSLHILDVGKQMGTSCFVGNETALTYAKQILLNNIKRDSAGKKSKNIFLLYNGGENYYSGNANLENVNTAKNETALNSLIGSLNDDVSNKIINPPKKLYIYTANSSSLIRVLSDIKKIPNNIINTELKLFSTEKSLPNPISSSNNVRISFYGCLEKDGWKRYVQNLNQEISKKVSIITGYPIELISIGTNFNADLALDSSAIYQLNAKILEAYRITTSLRGEIHTVGELTKFIAAIQLQKGDINNSGEKIRDRSFQTHNPDSGYIQSVYYATNRKESEDDTLFYGGERSLNQSPVKYGVCEVFIPKNHKKGVIEKPLLDFKLLYEPKNHIYISKFDKLLSKEFFNKINRHLKSTKGDNDLSKDIVIFIHGFNVNFNDAVIRAAQIAYDTGFSGVPMLFSWPSDGKLLEYMSDREDATWSVKHVEEFLTDLVKKSKAHRIHIVAHSMGHQVLIGALNRISSTRKKNEKSLFGNIIFAAPDYDAELFKHQVASNIVSLADNWTLYTSKNDAALNVSTSFNSIRRLGTPVTSIEGMTVIDASNIEVTPWSVPEFHSYYATKQVIIRDIISTLKGVAASKRNLKPMIINNYSYWQVKQ